MNNIINNIWVLFVVVTIANGIVFKFRSKKHIEVNPDLKEGYSKLIIGWLIVWNIPWLIMGIGNISGLTNSFDYLNPKGMNPMVLAFHFSILTISLFLFVWVMFKNGAEMIAKHPGLIDVRIPGLSENPSPMLIKLLFGLMLLGVIAAVIVMCNVDLPIKL